MLSVIVTFLLLLLGSCVGVRLPVASVMEPAPAPLNMESIAIFTPEQAAAIGPDVPVAEVYWQPAAEDLIRLEADLQAHLTRTPALQSLANRFRAYQRQYLGYEIDGERYIYGNFFCDAFGIDWRQTWVVVDDGGDCYFSFTYRVADGTFPRLIVNGEA